MKQVGEKNQDFCFIHVRLVVSELWSLEDMWLEISRTAVNWIFKFGAQIKGFGWGREFGSHIHKYSI